VPQGQQDQYAKAGDSRQSHAWHGHRSHAGGDAPLSNQQSVTHVRLDGTAQATLFGWAAAGQQWHVWRTGVHQHSASWQRARTWQWRAPQGHPMCSDDVSKQLKVLVPVRRDSGRLGSTQYRCDSRQRVLWSLGASTSPVAGRAGPEVCWVCCATLCPARPASEGSSTMLRPDERWEGQPQGVVGATGSLVAHQSLGSFITSTACMGAASVDQPRSSTGHGSDAGLLPLRAAGSPWCWKGSAEGIAAAS
jgi:hypothetical protein